MIHLPLPGTSSYTSLKTRIHHSVGESVLVDRKGTPNDISVDGATVRSSPVQARRQRGSRHKRRRVCHIWLESLKVGGVLECHVSVSIVSNRPRPQFDWRRDAALAWPPTVVVEHQPDATSPVVGLPAAAPRGSMAPRLEAELALALPEDVLEPC